MTTEIGYPTCNHRSPLAEVRLFFAAIREPDTGLTYHVISGHQPTEGYAVSPYPEKSEATHVSKIKASHIIKYVKKNREALEDPEHHLGLWHDPSNNRISIDISVVKPSRDEAHKLALENDQKAYYDLKNHETVMVNPNATSGGTLNRRYVNGQEESLPSQWEDGVRRHHQGVREGGRTTDNGRGIGRGYRGVDSRRAATNAESHQQQGGENHPSSQAEEGRLH